MLSCREASRLLSQAQERRLGLGEHLALRLHLAICSACRNFSHQLDILRRACRLHGGRPSERGRHDNPLTR